MTNRLRTVLIASLLWLAGAMPSLAQSGPNWTYQYVPTPAEWQFWWTHKMDYNGTSACLVSGCTYTGAVITAPSTANASGFNIPPGVAPTTPNNGDIWETSSGIFARINGGTVQLSTGGASIGAGGTNQLAYYTAPSTINGLATANNGVLVTSGAGAPSISSTLPSGIAATNMNLTTPLLGVATGTSLALNGCSLSAFQFCAAGSGYFSGTSATEFQTVAGGNTTFNIDNSAASAATGLNIKSNAANSGLSLSVTSTVANEPLNINAKGASGINLGNVSTGTITAFSNLLSQVTSSLAFAVGPNGTTNPTFQVDDSTASSVNGLLVKSSASGSGIALSAISSATNEPLSLNAKGASAVNIGNVSTGSTTIGAGGGGLIVQSVFTATGLVTTADMANVTTAWTLFGNPSSSTAAVPAYFTIGSLTNKASPAATDLVVIQDQAASGQLKQATVSSIASAGSVSSIDGKTGAFTTGNGIDSTGGNVIELTAARRTNPTSQRFLAGTSGTYTTPANVVWLEIIITGGGGGGNGSGTSPGNGTNGNNSCWNTSGAACTSPVYQALGGNGGTGSGGGAGGTCSGSGSFVLTQAGMTGGGGSGSATNAMLGPQGGSSPFYSGGGQMTSPAGNAGNAGVANSGGGGSGATATANVLGGGGGGGAGCIAFITSSVAGTYTYAVAAAVTGGGAGTGGAAGGGGAGGQILVIEHYGSWLFIFVGFLPGRRPRSSNDNLKNRFPLRVGRDFFARRASS